MLFWLHEDNDIKVPEVKYFLNQGFTLEKWPLN